MRKQAIVLFAFLAGTAGGYYAAHLARPKHSQSYLHSGVQWQFSEAASRGDVREMMRLYGMGAEINAEPVDGVMSGFPAIVTAASGGRYAAVKWLIEQGADVNKSPNDTPLTCAKYRLDQTAKTIELLEQHGGR